MNAVRKGDVKPYIQYRASRFYIDEGSWFFHTREGVVQGPFAELWEAEEMLETYLQIFKDLRMDAPAVGGMLSASRWSALPVEMLWR